MKKVTLYTDGACSGNPGIGGYAAILIYKGHEKIISGGFKETTNNRMEVLAVIEGLKALKEACKVSVYSDSAYLVNAFELGWISEWQKNNWRTADKKPVKNEDLWQELLGLCAVHGVEFIKVKGHSDNEYNNRCDALARGEITKIKETLPPSDAGDSGEPDGAAEN